MEKTAHWILEVVKNDSNTFKNIGGFYCSKCKCGSLENGHYTFPSHEYYCHSCGAYMTEEPEIVIVEKEEYDSRFGKYTWE